LSSRAEGAQPRRAELKLRVASGTVLAAIALAANALGGVSFAVLVTVVGAIALWEWTGITGAVEPFWMRVAAILCLCAGLLALGLTASRWGFWLLGAVAAAALIAGLVNSAARWTGLGLLYVAVPATAFMALRGAEPYGWIAVLFVIVIVAASDTGAYFGGRAIGGPKLWARVSPKKTWSGALSGLAAAVIAGGLIAMLTGTAGFGTGMALGCVLSIAAQAGDLLESSIKRRFGAKDSGRIIPGHGGVLDRVDGLFTAAALAWLLAALELGGELLAIAAAVSPLSGSAA
jgi:phosphatidate cytidylyltransferase